MLMSERYWVLNNNDMTIPGNISVWNVDDSERVKNYSDKSLIVWILVEVQQYFFPSKDIHFFCHNKFWALTPKI